MKISTQTRYSLRMLCELAMHADTGIRITTQQVARSQGISEKYLESIATKLQKGGLISSSKGFGGGYRLTLPATEITMGMVMRLMETNFFVKHCVKDAEVNCAVFQTCVIHEFLDVLEEAISSVVDKVTIHDICERYAAKNSFGQHAEIACVEAEPKFENIKWDIEEVEWPVESWETEGCPFHQEKSKLN